jgi:hypothetical protein
MKALTKLLLALCLVSHTLLYAQKPTTGCVDAAIEAQATGIKLGLSKKGMTVFQEGMFKMQSMEPIPVAVKLTAGIPYELIFVGSESANRLTMEIFDGTDNKIDERIERSMNNIVYSFTPQKTDVYLVTLYQKRGLKDMCGYFGVMMKGTPRPAAPKRDSVKKQPAAVKPATTTTKKSVPQNQSTKVNTSKSSNAQAAPDNQRPNPNRTKATREAQQQKGK